jgi:hypothetical protein
MKKLWIGLLVLGSFSSFAHVSDADKFIDIGNISMIKIQKDLNIKPNTNRTLLRHGQSCYIEHNSVNYDRVISKGKQLKFSKVYYVVTSHLKRRVNLVGIQFDGLRSSDRLYCEFGGEIGNVSVGNIKAELAGSVQLRLSSPIEMD